MMLGEPLEKARGKVSGIERVHTGLLASQMLF